MKQSTIKVSVIPVSAVPSQNLSVLLNGQNCQIAVYQKTTGLYADLSVNNTPVFSGQICRDRVSLIRNVYSGFIGDIYFKDTQGASDPDYTQLGTRFIMAYMVPV